MAPVQVDRASPRRSDGMHVKKPSRSKKTSAIPKTRRTAAQLTAMLDKACDQLELLQRKKIDLEARCWRAESAGRSGIALSLVMQLNTVAEVRRCYYKVAEKLAEKLQEHPDVAEGIAV